MKEISKMGADQQALKKPKFAWVSWISLVFGVTLGNILGGILDGQITTFYAGIQAACIAGAISAVIVGVIEWVRYIYLKKDYKAVIP